MTRRPPASVDTPAAGPFIFAMIALSRRLCSVGVFCASAAFATDFVPPQPLPAGRYDKMVEDWPFTLATPAAPVVEATAGFAVNLHVMGISRERYPDGKERDVVTVKSHADQTSFRLFGNEPNKEGISVAGVEWSDRVGKSKVTLKKGAEFAPLEFDQSVLHSSSPMPQVSSQPRPGGAPGALAQPRPGAPTTSLPGGLPPGNNNALKINGPRNQPVIPRPNSVPPVLNQPPAGAFPQALPAAAAANQNNIPANDPRRRVRVINSKP